MATAMIPAKSAKYPNNTALLKMEPVVGFEPTTDGLQNRCSTTELNWLFVVTGQSQDGIGVVQNTNLISPQN
jgi:hypothetical protein